MGERASHQIPLRQVVAGCRACQHILGRTHTPPRQAKDVPDVRVTHVDSDGWVHDHPITAETEALADQVHGPLPAGNPTRSRPDRPP